VIAALGQRLQIDAHIVRAAEDAFERVAALHYDAQATNRLRMVELFMQEGLPESDLAGTTGYGYDDAARARYEHLLAQWFGAEAALARLSIVSGTHAIVAALAACVPSGKTLLSASGRPYDTLHNAIALAPHALTARGMRYREIALDEGGFRTAEILSALEDETVAALFVQRSRGYAPRPSLGVATCEALFARVKAARPDVLILVDNCYGELVETREPTHAGADLVMGSLIKNLGGSIAVAGGYIAGRAEVVERVAAHLYAPGLGSALGPTLGFGRSFFQGLYLAPLIVEQTLHGLDFTAALFERLGYAVSPRAGDVRTDIVQAIGLGTREAVLAFARGLQRSMPVNARFAPEPGSVPGYADAVVMSGGAFVSGSTIELSCDAPLRPPFEMYVQGGVSTEQAMIGSLLAADAVGPSEGHTASVQKRSSVNTEEEGAKQRQFYRAPVDFTVSVVVGGDEQPLNADARDLSGGGMQIATERNLSRGDQLQLRFRLPNGKNELLAHGVVVLSFFEGTANRYHHGIAFTRIGPSDQDAIVQYIHELARERGTTS